MKLVGSKTSPYVRKIRVILAERGLPYEFIEESAWTVDTTVPRYNPLNKVPALVLDNGESIYDSAVISEYLDAISGNVLIPGSDPEARAKVRRGEALGDGLADAGITAFLERKREVSRQDPAWVGRQLDKVNSSINVISKELGRKPFLGGDKLNLADIACGCALFWAEFRMPELGWRESDSQLRGWAERLEIRPSFVATKPG